MQYRPLGQSGIDASVVAFGAWAIGGWLWGGTDEDAAIKAIHATVDNGITLIDTAPMYGFGESERVVGKAIKEIRDSVVLATKCGLNWWDAEGGEFFFDTDKMVGSTVEGEAVVRRNLNPASIRKELEDSLMRLGTDRIDLYQTHWQESTTSIEDTMNELLKMKAEGKIRAIGCSNVTTGQMEEYRKAGQLDSDQELFSMLDQKHVKSNLPYCKSHNVAYLAYSPIAQGLLTGKVGPERVFESTDQRSSKSRFSVENRKKVAAMLEEFKPIADGHGITLAQLAIAWTVAQPGCTHALVGARTPQQVAENAKAGDVKLTDEEISVINAAIATHSPE